MENRPGTGLERGPSCSGSLWRLKVQLVALTQQREKLQNCIVILSSIFFNLRKEVQSSLSSIDHSRDKIINHSERMLV